jgi:hypothetical protein
LANLLQSSRSTLSRGSFLSFLAFKEGMLSTPISVLGGWPTVSPQFLRLVYTEYYFCGGGLIFKKTCTWGLSKHPSATKLSSCTNVAD